MEDPQFAENALSDADASIHELLVSFMNATQSQQILLLHSDVGIWMHIGKQPVLQSVPLGALIAGMFSTGQQTMEQLETTTATGLLLQGDETNLYVVPLSVPLVASALLGIVFAPRSHEGMIRLKAQQLQSSLAPLLNIARHSTTADVANALHHDAAFQKSVTDTIDNVLRDKDQLDLPSVKSEES